MPKGIYKRPSVAERFHTKYQQMPSGCWIWIASCYKEGYGQFKIDGRSLLAHRVSWELTYGPVADELFVLHHCDVKRCVNPDHLFLGTQVDNIHDRDTKERQIRGETHHQAKLTEVDVLDIRKRRATGISAAALAREYGMSATNIKDICRRRIWRHI